MRNCATQDQNGSLLRPAESTGSCVEERPFAATSKGAQIAANGVVSQKFHGWQIFLNLDYACTSQPFTLPEWIALVPKEKRRKEKRWGIIFKCMICISTSFPELTQIPSLWHFGGSQPVEGNLSSSYQTREPTYGVENVS